MAITTAVDGVLAALRSDPSKPRFTGYVADGRTELSGTVLLNWAAKVAGLLVDELGAAPGALVVVRTPAHWQTAGILLGAWWAGMTVKFDDDPTAIAAFVAPGEDADADEVFVVSGHPLGAPSRDLAGHQRDYTTSVLGQADRFAPRWPVAGAAAVVITSAGIASADGLGDRIGSTWAGLTSADRVLTAGAWSLGSDVVPLLLAPLASGASVIHSLDLDPAADHAAWARRARTEKATVSIGVGIADLPRLD